VLGTSIEYLLVATEYLLVATEYLPVATEYLLGVTDYLLGTLIRTQMYNAANCLPPLAPRPTDHAQAFEIFAKGTKEQLCDGADLQATAAGFQGAFSAAPFGAGTRFANARSLSSLLGSTSAAADTKPARTTPAHDRARVFPTFGGLSPARAAPDAGRAGVWGGRGGPSGHGGDDVSERAARFGGGFAAALGGGGDGAVAGRTADARAHLGDEMGAEATADGATPVRDSTARLSALLSRMADESPGRPPAPDTVHAAGAAAQDVALRSMMAARTASLHGRFPALTRALYGKSAPSISSAATLPLDVLVAATIAGNNQLYGHQLAAFSAARAKGQCPPACGYLAHYFGSDAAADDLYAHGIRNGTFVVEVGALDAAVGYLPLGSLALQLIMLMFQSNVGKLVASFYAMVEGLQLTTGGVDDPYADVDLRQVSDLAAAYRELAASGATYDYKRVLTAICKALKGLTRSTLSAGQRDGRRITLGEYADGARDALLDMLDAGGAGDDGRVASVIDDLVGIQLETTARLAGLRAIDGEPARRALNYAAPGAAPAGAAAPGRLHAALARAGRGYGSGPAGTPDPASDPERARATHPCWNGQCHKDVVDFHYSCRGCFTVNPRATVCDGCSNLNLPGGACKTLGCRATSGRSFDPVRDRALADTMHAMPPARYRLERPHFGSHATARGPPRPRPAATAGDRPLEAAHLIGTGVVAWDGATAEHERLCALHEASARRTVELADEIATARAIFADRARAAQEAGAARTNGPHGVWYARRPDSGSARTAEALTGKLAATHAALADYDRARLEAHATAEYERHQQDLAAAHAFGPHGVWYTAAVAGGGPPRSLGPRAPPRAPPARPRPTPRPT